MYASGDQAMNHKDEAQKLVFLYLLQTAQVEILQAWSIAGCSRHFKVVVP